MNVLFYGDNAVKQVNENMTDYLNQPVKSRWYCKLKRMLSEKELVSTEIAYLIDDKAMR